MAQKQREMTLITGASSGIGLELAYECARHEHDLILVARSKDILKKVKMTIERTQNSFVEIFECDLTKPRAVEMLAKKIEKKGLKINNLINNAGFGTSGNFQKSDIKRELQMINLNCSSLVELTHTFLPQVVKKKGRILNVASTAAFQPIPFMSVYAATKSFVLSFSEALNSEIKTKGASVTALCPGPTKTNFDKVAKLSKSVIFSGSSVMNPDEVAKIGFNAMVDRKSNAVAGTQNKVGALFTRFIPMSTSASIAKKIMSKK
jgi:short-subunit dehydrogenase